ncbi:hypothetical protein [Desulfoferrobacter suflitae]|uniref:hypothetical protein n=1 Tax=Desulfoferrobacter suflitae TaxID=2865782 RepID=UPI00216452C9|nr:hypothetical protein [Desulfoferrobacter suflitae]MCK8602109.1 hypothetical protein [Desulfoferrobacter suflitae]
MMGLAMVVPALTTGLDMGPAIVQNIVTACYCWPDKEPAVARVTAMGVAAMVTAVKPMDPMATAPVRVGEAMATDMGMARPTAMVLAIVHEYSFQ